MASPQPSGYYGLQLHEEIETDITSLDKDDLAFFISEIAQFIGNSDKAFCSAFASQETDFYVQELKRTCPRILTSLLKWVCDRLEFLQTLPAQEVK